MPDTTEPKTPPRILPPVFPFEWAIEWGEDREYGLYQKFEIGGVAYCLRWVPPTGEEGFLMGEGSDEHTVILTQGYWMGETQVTQELWEAVAEADLEERGESLSGSYEMNSKPSRFKGNNLPVECVSWDDCETFLRKAKAIIPGLELRLPTEAEWEYACRAGSRGKYCFGDDEGELSDYAWFDDNSAGNTHPVALKKPNTYGLYDMHGNVWEWCEDRYGEYPDETVSDPHGPKEGAGRVLRGGSWNDLARFCRSARRNFYHPGYRSNFIGFRLARGQ